MHLELLVGQHHVLLGEGTDGSTDGAFGGVWNPTVARKVSEVL